MVNDMVLAIENARDAARPSQRALAAMTEIILIADATGCTVAQLTGSGVADRVRCAARATNRSSMSSMRQRLLHFMELDGFLDDHAIPAS